MHSRLDFLLTPGYAHPASPVAPHSHEDEADPLSTQVETTESELPPAQRHIIKRPRLTRLLDEAEARVLLLVAPAGYGKTTLAREWVGMNERRALWCHIERSSRDPASMANVLASAVRPLLGDRETRLTQYLRISGEPDPTAVAALLAEETPGWPEAAWLLIDDYHWLTDSEASDALIRAYIERTGAQALITSRKRPAWVTARTLLYGQVFELGQSALALTHEEAAQILADRQKPSAALIALADGWPAVIGLASFLKTDVTTRATVPEAIHRFLTEELFGGLDTEMRSPLVLLAFVETIERPLLRSLIGDDAERLITSASRQGLLTQRGTDTFEIHPLVRTFLGSQIAEVRDQMQPLGLRLVDLLIDFGRPDEAFSVIQAFEFAQKVPLLLNSALEAALAAGRVATIERWVEWGRNAGLSDPVVLLAEAELFIRRGQTDAAEALASSAAKALTDPRARAQAHLCAGRAAGLSDRANDARAHFAVALATDDSLEVRQQAAWGQFISSAYLRDDAAFQEAYEEFTRIPDVRNIHVLRIRQAEFIYASRFGNVSAAVARLAGAESLLELIDDPLPRTGFLNNLALSLNLAAHYVDAKRVARREAEEGARWHLDFVLPNAYFMDASADIGLGAFAEASATIDRAATLSPTTDIYAVALAAVLRAKLHISSGHLDSALACLAVPFEAVRDDLRGELYATLALAHSLAGCTKDARVALDNARGLAILVETKVLAAASEAVLALGGTHPDDGSSMHRLAHAIEVTGNYDNLICALRGSEELLQAMIVHPRGRDVVETAAVRSGDPTLCSIVGIERRPPLGYREVGRLSQREHEVLELVSQGFTNVQIGKRLFISAKTVKTHLQHVYEKLDVNSRTAAVTKARAAGYLSGGDLE
jgi:LuxR family maltose regulon positive regulatory protein